MKKAILLGMVWALAFQTVCEAKPVVGAYYFPGWQAGSSYWSDLQGLPGSRSPGRAWPERMPLLGNYPEGEDWVTRQHLSWAKSHAIDFFVYDWYWDAGRPKLDHALSSYLRNRPHNDLAFGILWANHGSQLDRDQLRQMSRFWAQHYFKRPDYIRLDGRPLVWIFSPRDLRRQFGSSGAKQVVAEIRAEAKGAGLLAPYIVACARPQDLLELESEGYDAASGYHFPLDGYEVDRSYQGMIATFEQMWRQFARKGRLPYFPVTAAGWDPRPWRGPQTEIRTGASPEAFEGMLRRARTFTMEFPQVTKEMVLIEAWNEFGEGSYIEPTQGLGWTMLDAVWRVFGSGRLHPHDLVGPKGQPNTGAAR